MDQNVGGTVIFVVALVLMSVAVWIPFRGSKLRYSLIKSSSFSISDNAANYASLVRQGASKNLKLMGHYMSDPEFRGDRTPFVHKGHMMVWDHKANKYVRGQKIS